MATPEELELERARQARLKSIPLGERTRYTNLEKEFSLADANGEVPEGVTKDEWIAARLQRAAR